MDKFPQCIVTEFERKVDVQNHEFGWVRFQNRFFKLLNHDDQKYSKNSKLTKKTILKTYPPKFIILNVVYAL